MRYPQVELQRAQAASGADAPVLLSVDTRAGHGMGKPEDAAALEFADQLAFAAHDTGLAVEPGAEGAGRTLEQAARA